MKAILLCGGYAKRLWPLTKNMPKPLLKLGEKEILTIILEKIEKLSGIDKIFVSTNAKFEGAFRKWIKEQGHEKRFELIVEPTQAEKEKFGAIAGLNFLIEQEEINDDVLIIAGDNLFDFEVADMINFYYEKKAPVIAVYDVGSLKKASLYGIVKTDSDQKIAEFEEKPEEPQSTLAATCCYIFPKEILTLFKDYLDAKNNPDAPGFFIKWLSSQTDVYAFAFHGHWFDIGDFESLEKAKKYVEMIK